MEFKLITMPYVKIDYHATCLKSKMKLISYSFCFLPFPLSDHVKELVDIEVNIGALRSSETLVKGIPKMQAQTWSYCVLLHPLFWDTPPWEVGIIKSI
jgi:hypothetical protein